MRLLCQNRTDDIKTCDTSGDMSPCLGGVDGTKCADGHEGPRCASCSLPDRYYDSASATCKECGNVEHYALKQLAVLLVIIIVFALLRFACFRKPRLLARISSRLAQFLASMQHLGLQAKWVGHSQTLTHPTSHHRRHLRIGSPPHAQVQATSILWPSVAGARERLRLVCHRGSNREHGRSGSLLYSRA
jgi:hypothetical protein